MPSLLLTLSRLCIAAWVGIASFFVTILLGLRSSDLFTRESMLNHPKVLFPLFYQFEFGLLGFALLAGLAARNHSAAKNLRFRIYVSLLATALVMGIADYFAIYRPLAAMIDLPALPPDFTLYHQLSRAVNSVSLLLASAAALLVLSPEQG